MKAKLATFAVAGMLAVPAMAAAHVTVAPTEAPSDSYAQLNFSVPHGCEGSPTTRIAVQIPESVPSVTPQRNPFWDLKVKEGPKDPVELHGEEVTSGVSEVIWTAREPLPDHQLDVLGMSVKLPAAEGETLAFPVIQTCEQGSTRWVQIPAEGESEHDLDSPAPLVTLTAGSEHGAEAEAEHSDDVEAEPAAAIEEGDDGDAKGIAVAGLVVGGLGLISAGVALTRGRR